MIFLKKLWNKIKPKTQQQIEHDWLAQSSDLVDLERRQKLLTNRNLKGWV